MWRPGRARLWLSLVVPGVVALCGCWTARHHELGFLLLVGAAVTAGWEVIDRCGRAERRMVLLDDRLLIDGVPFEPLDAWAPPGWLVMRGRTAGRRDRLAIHRSEVTEAEFRRLRRFCIRRVPRFNRPRFLPHRARR